MSTNTPQELLKTFNVDELFQLKNEGVYEYSDRTIAVTSYTDTITVEITYSDGREETFINYRTDDIWKKLSTDKTNLPDSFLFDARGSSTSIILTWNEQSASGFVIYIDDKEIIEPNDVLTYTISDLTPDKTYKVSVAKRTASGFVGAYARPKEVLVGYVPVALTNIQVTNQENGEVNITFDDPSLNDIRIPNPTKYVFRDITDNNKLYAVTSRSWIFGGLSFNQRVTMECWAENTIGKGAVTRFSFLYGEQVYPPVNVNAVQSADRGVVTISWNQPSDMVNIQQFEIRYKKVTDANYQSLFVSSSSNSIFLGTLDVGEWQFGVRSVGSFNTSGFVDAASTVLVSSLADPVDPASITGTLFPGNIIRLTWDSAKDATGYEVFVDGRYQGEVTTNSYDYVYTDLNPDYEVTIQSRGTNGLATESQNTIYFSLNEFAFGDVEFVFDDNQLRAVFDVSNLDPNGIQPSSTEVNVVQTIGGIDGTSGFIENPGTTITDTNIASLSVPVTNNLLENIKITVTQVFNGNTRVKNYTYDTVINVNRVIPPDMSVESGSNYNISLTVPDRTNNLVNYRLCTVNISSVNDGKKFGTTDISGGGIIDIPEQIIGAKVFSSNQSKQSYLLTDPPSIGEKVDYDVLLGNGKYKFIEFAGKYNTVTQGSYKMLEIPVGNTAASGIWKDGDKLYVKNERINWIEIDGTDILSFLPYEVPMSIKVDGGAAEPLSNYFDALITVNSVQRKSYALPAGTTTVELLLAQDLIFENLIFSYDTVSDFVKNFYEDFYLVNDYVETKDITGVFSASNSNVTLIHPGDTVVFEAFERIKDKVYLGYDIDNPSFVGGRHLGVVKTDGYFTSSHNYAFVHCPEGIQKNRAVLIKNDGNDLIYIYNGTYFENITSLLPGFKNNINPAMTNVTIYSKAKISGSGDKIVVGYQSNTNELTFIEYDIKDLMNDETRAVNAVEVQRKVFGIADSNRDAYNTFDILYIDHPDYSLSWCGAYLEFYREDVSSIYTYSYNDIFNSTGDPQSFSQSINVNGYKLYRPVVFNVNYSIGEIVMLGIEENTNSTHAKLVLALYILLSDTSSITISENNFNNDVNQYLYATGILHPGQQQMFYRDNRLYIFVQDIYDNAIKIIVRTSTSITSFEIEGIHFSSTADIKSFTLIGNDNNSIYMYVQLSDDNVPKMISVDYFDLSQSFSNQIIDSISLYNVKDIDITGLPNTFNIAPIRIDPPAPSYSSSPRIKQRPFYCNLQNGVNIFGYIANNNYLYVLQKYGSKSVLTPDGNSVDVGIQDTARIYDFELLRK